MNLIGKYLNDYASSVRTQISRRFETSAPVIATAVLLSLQHFP